MLKNIIGFAMLCIVLLLPIYGNQPVEVDRAYIKEIDLKEIDLIGYNRDTGKYLFYMKDEDIKNLNVPYEIFHFNKSKEETGYLSSEEIYDSMRVLKDKLPNLCRLDTIGYTYENRPLLVFCIGKDENNPAIMVMGCHHAREVQTPGVVLFYIDSIVRGYINGDSVISNLLDKVYIYAVPIVNPDGYDYALTEDEYWRKNRHYFSEWDSYGVDPNRNYSGGCNGKLISEWGTMLNTATSHIPTSNVFCGPYPFSERETEAVRDFIKSHNNIRITLSYHSYGEDVLFPWGSTDEKAYHYDDLRYIASNIAQRIIGRDGEPYNYEQSVGLYPTTGDSDDWIYGYSFYVKGKPVFPFTIECDNTFRPDTDDLYPLYKSNFNGILYASFYVDSLDKIVNPMGFPAIDYIKTDSLPGDSIQISFSSNNTEEYVLEFWYGISSIFDNAEKDKSYFVLNGFEKTEDSYEGDSAYFSGTGSKYYSSMVTRVPVFGDSLSFNIKYDMGTQSTFLVEYSKDNYCYKNFQNAIFYGKSNGWEKKTVYFPDTDGYYVRFRFSSYNEDNGVNIDNISGIPYFDSISKVLIKDTLIKITRNAKDNLLGVFAYNGEILGKGKFLIIKGIPPDTISLFNRLTKDYIVLSLPEGEGETDVKIADLSGRVIASFSFPYYNNKINIDVSGIPQGLYIIYVIKGDIKRSFKFLKIYGGKK